MAGKSFAGKVRAAAQKLKEFTVGDIVDALSPKKYLRPDKVDWTLRDMLKRGEIDRIAPGVYRYAQPPDVPVATRACRAMHVKGSFTASDIVMLSDAERSYVNTLIRGLLAAGHLEHGGVTRAGSGKNINVFRIVHRDRFYLEHCR